MANKQPQSARHPHPPPQPTTSPLPHRAPIVLPSLRSAAEWRGAGGYYGQAGKPRVVYVRKLGVSGRSNLSSTTALTY